MADPPYNPLDKTHLGESVAKALLERPISPLPPTSTFIGAGIYAIYYFGSSALYRPISKANQGAKFEQPIYVGKAVPKGARKGGFGLGLNPGNVLYSRLRQHAASIQQVLLPLKDFSCRYLVTDDIWIPLGESLLIERFQPIWNKLIDGFGNHNQGRTRTTQEKSRWDAVHPGRPWADVFAPRRETREQLLSLIRKFQANPASVPTITTADAMINDDSEE